MFLMPNRSAQFQCRIAWLAVCAVVVAASGPLNAGADTMTVRRHAVAVAPTAVPVGAGASVKAVADKYCVGCHNERLRRGELVLEHRDPDRIAADAEVWERVVRKLHGGAMPPPGSPRPDKAAYQTFISNIERILDTSAATTPNPGRPPIHRLNRLEYTNAIRDIFGFEIDGAAMLPADDSGYGFDNIADVLTVSPGLLERYMLAAAKISRLAVGDPTQRPGVAIYDVGDTTLGQYDRMNENLPFGSRGGAAIRHHFPLDGEYVVKFQLQRVDVAASNMIRGLDITNLVDVRLDRQRLNLFTIGGANTTTPQLDGGLYYAQEVAPDAAAETRFFAKAGMHTIAISMNRDVYTTEGTGVGRLPLTSEVVNADRMSTQYTGLTIQKVFVTGPFHAQAPMDSPSYRRLFVCTPSSPSTGQSFEAAEAACARRILATVARRAYHRPPTDAEVNALLEFYRTGRKDGTFESGIRTGLERMLVDVNFLFRMEHDPTGAKAGAIYPVSDLELASRLSFFLWSSVPDQELLSLAEQGRLRSPGVLEHQVRRMLADSRAKVMIANFFGQWLYLRNIATHKPDKDLFPEFDENLRVAFQQETQLFLESQIRDDRPATELLTANYTFLNERLARHYGIPDVVGSHFRRVTLSADSPRGGLLGQGGVLMVTSYADRTSVVLRGKYILQNLLGIPPPPPPPNVPPLDATEVKGTLRQRMETHRKNPVCASCHNAIDPLGFALENFDGVGRFRAADHGAAINASGALLDGTKFDGPLTFRQGLAAQREAFLGTLTEKFLTYAMGRGVEYFDMPSVRQIVRDAAASDYRWSALVLGIVKSTPFQMRRAES
jgi:hypothetical protein